MSRAARSASAGEVFPHHELTPIGKHPETQSATNGRSELIPVQETIRIRTRKKWEVVDITPRVVEIVTRANVAEGVCTVYVRHATAAQARISTTSTP